MAFFDYLSYNWENTIQKTRDIWYNIDIILKGGYMKVRLDRLLANTGYGTRKEVKLLIRKGHVKVNSTIVKKDDLKIDTDKDKVYLDDELVGYQPFVYLMLNKPAGCVSATVDQLHETVIDLIEGYDNYELFPVGRLDKDTEGLMLITNDGGFAHLLMAPRRKHAKIYFAHVKGRITDEHVKQFEEGVVIDTGYKCQSARLTILDSDDDVSTIEVEITEGKFHQVKKMFMAIGSEVLYLKRTQIRNLKLDKNLQLGEFRELTKQELIDLKENL